MFEKKEKEFEYPKALKLLMELEGFRKEAYRCPAGVLTIGYGHTECVVEEMLITQSDAETLLKQDILDFAKGLNKILPCRVNKNQFQALISFVYNIGISAFVRSTCYKRIREQNFNIIPNELRRWVFADGIRLNGLANRREKEAMLWQESVL